MIAKSLRNLREHSFVWSSITGCPPSCAHLRRIIVSQVWERVTSCLCWYVWIHNHYHNWYNMLTFCWLLSSSFYRFSSALQDTQDCVRVVCVFVSLKHNKYVICSAANRLIGEVVQSQRRPLGPSLGWKRLLALSHLRHYAKLALTPRSLNVKLGPRRNYHKDGRP